MKYPDSEPLLCQGLAFRHVVQIAGLVKFWCNLPDFDNVAECNVQVKLLPQEDSQ
jgi:hypothetical protein